ncbi:hypothetical protein J25TS5_31680 [Paenibacillus faecis]|nr:hypothetical protein J25TS5_31680 [Paenibacillus faecis]
MINLNLSKRFVKMSNSFEDILMLMTSEGRHAKKLIKRMSGPKFKKITIAPDIDEKFCNARIRVLRRFMECCVDSLFTF